MSKPKFTTKIETDIVELSDEMLKMAKLNAAKIQLENFMGKVRLFRRDASIEHVIPQNVLFWAEEELYSSPDEKWTPIDGITSVMLRIDTEQL